MGSNASDNECYLRKKEAGKSSETIYFHHVQSISDSINAKIVSKGTIIFGYDNRFVMDIGVVRSFTLRIVRPNPPDYDDDSPDQDKWSNGKWFQYLRDFTDFWQNMGRDPTTDSVVGGMQFYFAPRADCIDEYPPISCNVFIAGTIEGNFAESNLSILKISIPLRVGRMTSEGVSAGWTVTYYKDNKQSESFQQFYPIGSSAILAQPPPNWSVDGRYYDKWVSDNRDVYYPGQSLAYTGATNVDMIGGYSSAKRYVVETVPKDADTPYILTVPSGVTRMATYLIGGGGAGSLGARKPQPLGGISQYNSGGAGGAGQLKYLMSVVQSGDKLEYNVGRGGAPDDDYTGKANDGTSTYIKIGSTTYSANGGHGGYAGSFDAPGAGGAEYEKGGTGAKYDADGNAGATSTYAQMTGIPGEPTQHYKDMNRYFAGASGGGAVAFNKTINGTNYVSKGGDGYKYQESNPAGMYGGGGGSASSFLPGAGGNGLICIIFL